MRASSWSVLVIALAVASIASSKTREATAQEPEGAARAERCAVRLSISLFGTSPSAELLADPDPQRRVDAMVQDPAFDERFARFLNARFDAGPGQDPLEDAVYYVAKDVLEKKQRYEELFLGTTRVQKDAGGTPVVVSASDGLGYFRTPAWLRRYAGNEADGYKISTAYRILNNTVGLELAAMTNVPGADLSAKGRWAQPCVGCHNQGWFALDRASKVLSRRRGVGDKMTFDPPSDGPQEVADKRVSDDKELVAALVASTAFRFNACRLAFRFLLGRPENACESKVFDACMTTFESTGMIQSAVAVVAKDETSCR